MSSSPAPFYPSGHDAAVVNSHATRTAANSAAFLLPLLRKSDRFLDVGCGPGSISVSFAEYVDQVVGVEHPSAGPEVLEAAKKTAREAGVQDRATFQAGDALALPFPDNSFDVVYCHQVLQHVHDPVSVLREMKRVSKRLVSAREADRGSFILYPHDKDGLLNRFTELWYAVARAGGGEPDGGRRLKSWALSAGFTTDQVSVSAATSCPDARVWGEMWAERTVNSGFAKKAVELGLSSEEELGRIAQAWTTWSKDEGAWTGYLQGELVAKVDE